MTKAEQRTAIAEACGWEWKYFPDMGDGGSWGWVKGQMFPQNAKPLPFPDHPNDLNAMHVAEEVLLRLQRDAGHDMNRSEYGCWSRYVRLLHEANLGKYGGSVHADAGQRAEAFCRTLWPERFRENWQRDAATVLNRLAAHAATQKAQ